MMIKIMKKKITVIWLFVVALSLTGVAQQADVATIVASHLPSSLLDEKGRPIDKGYCYAIYSGEQQSPSEIVAAYMAGGVVFLRRSTNGEFLAVSQLTVDDGYNFGGSGCRITLVDLDGDGANEIAIAFQTPGGGKGTSDWYLRWDGTHLLNLGPTRKGFSQLLNSCAEDLYHDGRLEVIAHEPVQTGGPTLDDVDLPRLVYSLSGTGLNRTSTLTYLRTFVRGQGQPVAESTSLELPAAQQSGYLLKVVNGGASTGDRVTSAHIWLNGTEVLGPRDLSEQTEFWQRTIQLNQKNSIKVQVEGKPNSQLTVLIRPQ